MNIFTANEKAAELLLHGKHIEAAQLFLAGLANLRTELTVHETESSTDTDCEKASDLDKICSGLFTVPIRDKNSRDGSACSKVSDDKHPIDFFKSAFLLAPWGLGWTTTSTNVLTAISAIVMFNAALSFHMEATKSGRSDLLRRALRIYTKCLAIINSSGLDVPLLSLATCSNMAHIQSEFFDTNALHNTTISLSRLLAEKSDSLKMKDEEMVFFKVQALTCKLTRTRRAPAA